MPEFQIDGLQLNRANWESTTLDEIAFDINERVNNPSESKFSRFVGLENIKSGELKIANWGETCGLTSAAKAFSQGDVLFARRNAYLKRASLVDFEGVCSGDAFVLRRNKDKVILGFLVFILNSEKLWKYANSNAAGTMSKRVKWRDLSQYKVSLPPLEQQEKLSDLIWAGDKNLDQLVDVKNKLNVTIQSVFKERCGLVQGGNEIAVKELLLDGPTNGFSPKGNSIGEGSQTVSIGAVRGGKFDADGNIKYAVVENEILDKFNIVEKDVFIVRGNGNKLLCGKAGISSKTYSNLFYPDLLVRLRFDNTKILPDFAAFQWNTLITHKKLLRSAKSSNGIWKINGEDIKRHKLFVPSICDQIRIMEEIANISANISLCVSAIATTRRLQSALINDIF